MMFYLEQGFYKTIHRECTHLNSKTFRTGKGKIDEGKLEQTSEHLAILALKRREMLELVGHFIWLFTVHVMTCNFSLMYLKQ